ncbi:TonB-dependent receptor [Ideonella livida]|uniref:TonB-dependent receptor n=1 Tax=Ideonella livida TaxID=2707176 RepID=A0A7C9THR3_9BURK|nr:TonB-dependent receptor [Ideonella livida]NDY90799.1 TonB-dependent receptor [Ideonella livida]
MRPVRSLQSPRHLTGRSAPHSPPPTWHLFHQAWRLLPPALGLALTASFSHAQATTAQVEVVGVSPLPGQGVPRDQLPYTTHVLRRGDIQQAQADTTTELLARRVPGLQVNDIQGSTFQGDLTFRGHRASGLLGASQGLSVYLDGVRINEAFGDVVNWDLVPEGALDSISLVSAANPAFGLNTLAGAISLQTASGLTRPGTEAELEWGAFGRKQLTVGQGGRHAEGWHHRLSVRGLEEDGWRDHSGSRVHQLHARVGRETARGDFSASLLLARTRLVGNGLVPWATLAEDGQTTPALGQDRRTAVYTHPDETRHRLQQLGLQWSRTLEDGQQLQALAYVRHSRRDTVNGDVAEEEEGGGADAALNQTTSRQRGQGLAFNWSGRSGEHQWSWGASFDHARVDFRQGETEAAFNDSRGVVALPGAEQALSATVAGSSRLWGLHATDTWRLSPASHLTVGLRANHATVGNTLASEDDDTGEFEAHPHERFTYRSLNPALGLTHRLGASAPTLFGSVARNTRVPTVIELGCADPQEPCRLPAGLQSDPYLRQVRATTLEGGLRWGHPTRQGGSLTLFQTDNRDDIVFGSVSLNGQLGYFQNFDRTRHRGLELSQSLPWAGAQWSASLSWLRATYEAQGVLRMGERNVQVAPGTRMAGLPERMAKVGADWTLGGGWLLGADVQAVSSRQVAGNEDGRLEDDAEETVWLKVPGHALLHLRASWQPANWPGVQWLVRLNNATNRHTASFGALAETRFDRDGQLMPEGREALFLAPGAPRALSLGLRARF